MHPIVERLSSERKARYVLARVIASHLAKILARHQGVSKVVLIGSATQENVFDVHSDIDLCVFGLAPEQYFAAVGELLIEAGEFSVDLIRIEDASESMREHINNGEILYVRT